MRSIVLVLTLVCAPAVVSAAQPTQLLISVSVSEQDAGLDGARPRMLSQPRLVTETKRKAELTIGSTIALPELEVGPANITTGLNLVITCGEPRDEKVDVDLVFRMAKHSEVENDLVAIDEQSVRLIGRLRLGKDQRIVLSKEGDAIERIAIVRIEPFTDEKRLEAAAPSTLKR